MASASLPSASIKRSPEDWRVDEILDDELSGSGEHLYLQIEKRGHNTADIAKLLAKYYGLGEVGIGYAGLKDKHAVTRQWFSVHTPSDAPPRELADDVICLAAHRHHRKLRRGEHSGNRFRLILRDTSELPCDLDVPFANAFGPQRVSPSNVEQAEQWLTARRRRRVGRGTQGWHLSVLRSHLFNAVLYLREERGLAQPLDGDVLDAAMPTGPLWGRGRSATQGHAAELEREALRPFAAVCEGLEYAGVKQGRRRLWVKPEAISVTKLDGAYQLDFRLPPGSYATALLAAHFQITDESIRG